MRNPMLTARRAIALTVLAAFAPAGCVATHAPVVESNMGVALSSALIP